MTPAEELDSLYVDIGSIGADITDAKLKRIEELEEIVNPIKSYKESDVAKEIGCGCGHPDSCWECAAIRGGCPEDV